LDQRLASFETPASRVPQDEEGFYVPSTNHFILRRPPFETPPRRLLRIN